MDLPYSLELVLPWQGIEASTLVSEATSDRIFNEPASATIQQQQPIHPPWEKKVWGSVWHIFANDQVAISYLRLNKGFRCSRHYHQNRNNFFAVLSGCIAIDIFGSEQIIHSEILRPGETCDIKSGIIHRFRVIESGEVVEVYRPRSPRETVQLDDIMRFDKGGPDT